MPAFDDLDARLLLALTAQPRATTLALAEATGATRNYRAGASQPLRERRRVAFVRAFLVIIGRQDSHSTLLS